VTTLVGIAAQVNTVAGQHRGIAAVRPLTLPAARAP
jgi:hypothetical protein